MARITNYTNEDSFLAFDHITVILLSRKQVLYKYSCLFITASATAVNKSHFTVINPGVVFQSNLAVLKMLVLKNVVNLIRLTLDSMTLSTKSIPTQKINCINLHTILFALFSFCTLLVFLVKNDRSLEMNGGDNN